MDTTTQHIDAESVLAPVLSQQQRQGDMLFTPIEYFVPRPDILVPITSQGTALTDDGNPHVAFVDGWATWQRGRRNDYVIGHLEVFDGSTVEIRHLDPDPGSRHQPLRLAPGRWDVRRQRRYIPAVRVDHESVYPARTELAEPGWQHGLPVRSSKGWNGIDVDVC